MKQLPWIVSEQWPRQFCHSKGHNVKDKGQNDPTNAQVPCQIDMPCIYEAVVIYSFQVMAQKKKSL